VSVESHPEIHSAFRQVSQSNLLASSSHRDQRSQVSLIYQALFNRFQDLRSNNKLRVHPPKIVGLGQVNRCLMQVRFARASLGQQWGVGNSRTRLTLEWLLFCQPFFFSTCITFAFLTLATLRHLHETTMPVETSRGSILTGPWTLCAFGRKITLASPLL
jgi:hypothetical protein